VVFVDGRLVQLDGAWAGWAAGAHGEARGGAVCELFEWGLCYWGCEGVMGLGLGLGFCFVCFLGWGGGGGGFFALVCLVA